MGSDYYPAGGMSDLTASFDTLDEALIYVSKNPDDWFQIVDSTTGFILE